MEPVKNILETDFQEGGLLLIDKPLTWTSFDVVNKVRYALKRRLDVKKIKVGHSGTLDPMATGLLILCTGRFTKKLGELQGLDKEYTGHITLGATTPTYDSEANPENETSVNHLTENELKEKTAQFIGVYDQIPPIFSAIKMKGQTAYELARRGKEVVMEPRRVEVHDLELTDISLPEVTFRVACAKGFYVRSLANDYGAALGVGGYLGSLRRTKIGSYHVEDAWNLVKLIEALDAVV